MFEPPPPSRTHATACTIKQRRLDYPPRRTHPQRPHETSISPPPRTLHHITRAANHHHWQLSTGCTTKRLSAPHTVKSRHVRCSYLRVVVVVVRALSAGTRRRARVSDAAATERRPQQTKHVRGRMGTDLPLRPHSRAAGHGLARRGGGGGCGGADGRGRSRGGFRGGRSRGGLCGGRSRGRLG